MKAYAIHLEDRIDRLENLRTELDAHYPGEWEIWNAVKHERGSIGLSMSYRQIFKKAIDDGLESILTFEDDVKFSSDRSRSWFEECASELPSDWDVLLGGVYTWKNPLEFNEKLLKCKNISGTHMVMWSKRACETLLGHRPEDGIRPYDIDRFIGETSLNVFICNPMVAYQIDSFSDVFNDKRDLQSMLSDKFFI